MHLTLHLTGRCNLRCRYCYDGEHRGGDMSFETVRAAIALAMESAETKLSEEGLGIGFFGGEPLLRRELIAETVRYCRRIETETGQRFHFKLTTNGLLLDKEFHVRPGSCRAERCELGTKQVSVAPNGRIYPCVQFVGDGTDPDWCIGDVATGFDDAARRQTFRQSDGEKGACLECAIRERCNHYCGCLNRQATGRVDTVSPVLCAHERIVLPIADAVATRLFRKRNALFVQKQYNDLYPLLSLLEDTSTES